MTRKEKLFIIKAYENKLVADSNILSAAVANAVSNVFRKKNQRSKKLWKIQPKPGDLQERQEQTRIAQQVAAQDT
ncbi:MAG: hypothetical protein K2J71_09195, partial [Oscillospiraceae bacterium]|nr:hypothetical protein [Oscillospiraceae bacterium]